MTPTVPARDAREVARDIAHTALAPRYHLLRAELTESIARALRDARRDALLWAADKIEVEPAVNAIPFAEMLRALASKEGAE